MAETPPAKRVVRVVRVVEVPGRPALSSPEQTGAAGLLVMAQLVRAAFALAGQELSVDRQAVRVLRPGDPRFEHADDE